MKRYCYILLLAIFPLLTKSQEVNKGNQLFNTKCDSIITVLMKKYGMVGFSMAVIDSNKPVLYKNYGFADLENRINTSENTTYRIASVSKVFTAMAVMKLRDEGRIDLNAPVEDYLTSLHFKYAPGLPVIKIRDLLTHTSGLSDNIDNGSMCSAPPAQETIIAEVNKQYLTISAGLKMNYSNTGYALLGCVIEQVSGEKYEDYVLRNFLRPMDMRHTGILHASESPANAAMGYLKDSSGYNEPVLRDIAAGGMYSSAADLTHLCRLMMNDGAVNGVQVMPAATLHEMMTNKIDHIRLVEDDEFGYGFFINNLGSDKDSLVGKNIGHGGDSRVFHSIIVTFPKLDIGFVLLTNAANGSSFTKNAVLQIAREYIRDVRGIPIQKGIKANYSNAAMLADSLDHSKIAGTYGSGGEDFVTIRKKSDRKLVFLQDKNKLVLKRGEKGIYSVTFRLLKFIPVKVKAASFAFRDVDGNIYMKTMDNKSKQAEYVSVKDKGVVIPQAWKSMVGKYTITNFCSGNGMLYPDELSIVGNKILLHRSDPMKEEDDLISFNVISETLAISDGIDRGAGSTLEILPDGNLYWSGFEMKMVK